ncbi:MAG: hypothetical protein JWO12_2809 [Frankiales bacterium]|nr:hypothetical protein [Frankiales bacterium]
MPRWTGTWLEGPQATLREMRHPDQWPGQRIGLPREGSGSVAPFGARASAMLIDIVASALVSGLIAASLDNPTPVDRQIAAYAVIFLELMLLVALTGQSVGMRMLDLKVVKLADVTKPPGFVTAFLRTSVLLVTVGLAGFFTRDGRGFHDLAAGAIVLRD